MLSFDMFYSTDGGMIYYPATVTGDTSGIFSGNYSGEIRWEIAEDLPERVGEAIIKLLPSDNDTGFPDSLTIRYNTFGVCNVALTVPDGEQNADITVSYRITDPKNHTVSLGVEYSITAGESWDHADTEGNITSISPDSYNGSFIWKAENDLKGHDGIAWLRVTPDNGAEGIPDIGVVTVDYNDPPSIESVITDTDKVYSV